MSGNAIRSRSARPFGPVLPAAVARDAVTKIRDTRAAMAAAELQVPQFFDWDTVDAGLAEPGKLADAGQADARKQEERARWDVHHRGRPLPPHVQPSARFYGAYLSRPASTVQVWPRGGLTGKQAEAANRLDRIWAEETDVEGPPRPVEPYQMPHDDPAMD